MAEHRSPDGLAPCLSSGVRGRLDLYRGPVRYRRADLRWAPVLVISAGLSLLSTLPVDSGLLWVPVVVLAYLAGRRMASLAVALWVFTAVAFIGLAVAFWGSDDPLSSWSHLVFAQFISAMLPWWVGRYRHLRAEQDEREQMIVAEQARLRERARIAQDMHDSLGHELALIALRGGALELAGGLTDQQRRDLGELRAGAVRANDRLHEIVQVLGNADAAIELHPADESIDDLVHRAARAGLPVRLRHENPRGGWSPMTSQAVHRVVLESLTNAARHAPGAPVTVTLTESEDDVRIEVRNEPSGQPSTGPGSGHGLIGLDERVRLAGGRLEAGPRPGGSWAVRATLTNVAGPPPAEGPAGAGLRVSKQLTRRRQLQTAALPLGAGVALAAALVVVEALTVSRSGLSEETFRDLRLGQPRSQVESVLPERDLGTVPRVIGGPGRPGGADCFFYLAGLFETDVYRLCFVDDVLVSKDRLERA